MMEAVALHEYTRSRERLSDKKMGDLISAVGNHEVKAIMISLIGDKNPYGKKDIYNKVLKAQGDNSGWVMNPEVPFGYCSKSFLKFGLVEKEIDPSSSVVRYRITEDGRGEGIPLAGLLLNFSEKYNISLDRFFGGTRSSSPEKRSPSTTLKILYALVISTHFPIRETDLAERVGEKDSSRIHDHIIRLSELGLIDYQGKEVNAPISRYKLSFPIPGGELPIFQNQQGLTRLVFDVIKAYPDKELTAGGIYSILPAEQKERWGKKINLKNKVSAILSFLNKSKYLELIKFNRDKQSEINITDTQKAILAELFEILYRFQNKDKEMLSEGKRFAEEIIANPQRVSDLLRRAKEASRNASQSSPEETQEKITSYVSSDSDGATVKDIQEFLKTQGKKLGHTQVRALLSSLVNSGSIRVGKEGKVSIFYPKKPEILVS